MEKSVKANNLTSNNSHDKPGSVDLQIPSFSGESSNEDPKRLLKDLDAYITHTKIAENKKNDRHITHSGEKKLNGRLLSKVWQLLKLYFNNYF